ncbi:hypothetical protein XENOCAPTIV_010018, partial [Xenoophorus captivus]
TTYFLTLKAVLGKNESVPSPTDGLTFSYFHSSLEGQKCKGLLDLPPVNVTPEPHHIQFQFKHPWLLYKEGLSGCKEHKNKKSHQRVSDDKKKHHPLMPTDDLVSPVGSVPVSPREEDEQSFTPSVPGSTEYEGRIKLKPEDPEKGNAADDDAAYMEGGNLASDNEEQESDQESRSPYERRSVVLELAPEDRAEGYRG